MGSQLHEIRDPIHVFVRLDSDERKVINSAPYQRLREIHQLAMTYLVYPGATHKRFEHCLGVMELASRIYDVVTDQSNLHGGTVRALVSSQSGHKLSYWRSVLRMAALCHDLGHLPFSHAAENELLPKGWNHERLSLEIIRDEKMRGLWSDFKLDPEDIGKLALGYKYPGALTDWEAILAEIIVGDVFGADRMDYLLRDSHHAGVAYGRFDHHRLIDTLRILPRSEEDSQQPSLGIEIGGLQSAESLLWARYLMYTQLYFHPVRRIYDLHLKQFLADWLPNGKFPVNASDHLETTDSEVLAAIRLAAEDAHRPGHDAAKRISHRKHFRLFYERNAADLAISPRCVDQVFLAAQAKFGVAAVLRDSYNQKGTSHHFPVLDREGIIQGSTAMSPTLRQVPTFGVDYVFIDPDLRNEATHWLRAEKMNVIREELVSEE